MKLEKLLNDQKADFFQSGTPDMKTRIDRINRIGKLLLENKEILIRSLELDFSTRDKDWTLLADFVPVFRHIKHAKNNLKDWMKRIDVQADVPFNLFGAKAYIHYEPLGVIGIIIPWNVPISLALHAALESFAAGNRVMLKVSENIPITGETLEILVQKYFKPEEFVIVNGGVDISKNFSKLPFDHLLFTGGSEIGKSVMKEAANNLTPVTLELGGKTPVVINRDADLNYITKKIIKARYINSGQVCISPDYVFLPEEKLEDFIRLAVEDGSKLYPTILTNNQYTSIINDTHYERVTNYLKAAIENGTRIITINPSNEKLPDKVSRKIPLTLVVDPDESLSLSKEEIFGPILIVRTYKNLRDAIEYVNQKPKPLALYYFGENQIDKDFVVNNTSSGGLCINEVMLHAIQNNLPFGGVGNSGIGRYGGYEGFKRFSNAKSVLEQGTLAKISTFFLPPFNSRIRKIIESELNF